MGFPLYIVDVFAERKLAGNQLAVIAGAGKLTTRQMQAIARETNFSETTFITSLRPKRGGYDTRIFTPRVEIPFAGHPTLGTAWVLARLLAPGRPDRVALNVKVGQIPVAFERKGRQEILWMKQIEPQFGPKVDPAAIARAIGLRPEEMDARFPAQEVSTGIPFIIAPVNKQASVRRAELDMTAFRSLVKGRRAQAVFFFCKGAEERGHDLHARMFAPLHGVAEDPATGSANGCLSAWLARHRYLGSSAVEAAAEQGYEMGRPSVLYLKSKDSGKSIDVRVGGKVFLAATGELA